MEDKVRISDNLRNTEKAKFRFEDLLGAAAALPGVRIDRAKFLRSEIGPRYSELVDDAVATTPLAAGLTIEQIGEIAQVSIKWETAQVSALSFVAGIPGGIAMAGTIPADLAQYIAHVLRIAQKLAYLYGWDDLFDANGEMDEDTKGILTIFVGVMAGAKEANAVLTKVAIQAQEQVAKRIAAKALTKTTYYPVIKKIAAYLGVALTKDTFGKGVSKVVPIIGGFVSGGVTFASFRPMCARLRDHLEEFAK